MAVNNVVEIFSFFREADGTPLDSGFVYIGEPGLSAEANPKAVYWDAEGTIPASLPIRTSGGFAVRLGAPSKVYVDGDYSITVKDAAGVLVHSKMNNRTVTSGATFPSLADLVADTSTGYTEGAVLFVEKEQFSYQVAASGATDHHLTTAGGVKLYVLADGGRFDVMAFNPNADGTTDDAATIQKAMTAAAGAVLLFPAGKSFSIQSAVTTTAAVQIEAYGATFVGGGVADDDVFRVTAAVDFTMRGGHFTSCLRGVKFTDADNIDISDVSFEDVGIGIGVNNNIASTGTATFRNITGKHAEQGISIQSSYFAHVSADGCKFFDIQEQTEITDRTAGNYPFNKKIAAGFWYQSTASFPASCHVTNCFVDGVTEFAVPAAQSEVHGLAVTLDFTAETDVVMMGNTVLNVDGFSKAEGNEGLMGRGRRVEIIGNTLKDAGGTEGMIYAKGSRWHNIAGNTVEITSGNVNAASARGIISTGSNCTVTNNKIIGCQAAGIYTRALDAVYEGNEFYDCSTACFIFAMEAGTTHVKTVVKGNVADDGCGIFFTDSTATTETRGDFLFQGNTLYNGSRAVGLKGGNVVKFRGNHVDRVSPDASREVLNFTAPVAKIFIEGNTFENFNDSGNTGRVITGNTTNTPWISVKGNHFGTGHTALWVRDQTYTDLMIDGNGFYSTTGVNATGANVTVNNMLSLLGNQGISPKQLVVAVASLPGTPKAGYRTWVNDSNTATFGATVAGGGANVVPVVYDGSNFVIGM